MRRGKGRGQESVENGGEAKPSAGTAERDRRSPDPGTESIKPSGTGTESINPPAPSLSKASGWNKRNKNKEISKGSRARRVEAFFLCGRQGSSLESRVRRSDLRAGLEQVARSYLFR